MIPSGTALAGGLGAALLSFQSAQSHGLLVADATRVIAIENEQASATPAVVTQQDQQ